MRKVERNEDVEGTGEKSVGRESGRKVQNVMWLNRKAGGNKTDGRKRSERLKCKNEQNVQGQKFGRQLS